MLVGTGRWHGIPCEMMKAELQKPSDGMLVVGVCKKTSIRIFGTRLKLFIEAKDKLEFNGLQYTFSCKDNSTYLLINEVPELTLECLEAIPFSRKNKKAVRKLRKEFNNLDTEAQEELLSILEKKIFL